MIKKLKRLSPFAGVISLALPVTAFAQAAPFSGNIVPNTIRPINNILSVLRAVIQFILVVAFVLAFIFLLIGGIRWITAGGDEKGVASARNMITAALIGLVVVLVAYALIRLVEIFFSVNIISTGIQIPVVNNTE